jgi:hypothetical protein
MTPKTLFNIILKVIGIFFIGDILITVPQLLSSIPYYFDASLSEAMPLLLFALLTLSAIVLVPYLLIFKSNYIINKLQLDKGFEEETIGMNVSRPAILSIALIVLGGLTLKDEIPFFCKELFTYFEQKANGLGSGSTVGYYFIVSGVKIIIAFCSSATNVK